MQVVHRPRRRAASGHHHVRISGRIPQRGHVRIEGVPHAPHLEHNATHPPDPRGQLRTKCITHLPHLRHPRLDELVAEQQHGHTRGTAHLDLVDSRGSEQADHRGAQCRAGPQQDLTAAAFLPGGPDV